MKFNSFPRRRGDFAAIVLTITAACLALKTYAIVDANSPNNTNAPPDGAPWANVGQVNGPSGIYLGAGWALTAAHVGPGNINLSGTIFPWDGTYHWLTNADGTLTDGFVFRLKTIPPLPRIPLASSTPPRLSQVDMIGFGYRAGSAETNFSLGTTGFYWSEVPSKGWGNNKINLDGVNSVYDGFTNNGVGIIVSAFATDFDSSSVPGLQTSHECQAAVGDSGGGVFYKNGSTWELAGMLVAINEQLTNRPFGSAVYTDQTYAVDIATYRSQIVAWIESTIPSLSIIPSGTNVEISWLDTGITYGLQATASLSPDNWTPLTPPLSLANGQFSALVPMSGGTRLFRLQKQ